MIHSVFELGDTIVREVMVPRTDVVCIERDKTLRQALSLCLRSGFSRIPVIGENVDDVVGIAYLKDLVRARLRATARRESTERVESVMRPAHLRARVQAGRRRCCARCRPQRTTSRSSSTSTAAPPAWSPSRTSSRRSSARSPTSTTGERAAGRAARRRRGPGHRPAARSTTSASCSTSSSRTTTSTPSAACWPSASAGCRSPGREVEVARAALDRREHRRPPQPDRHGARQPGRAGRA